MTIKALTSMTVAWIGFRFLFGVSQVGVGSLIASVCFYWVLNRFLEDLEAHKAEEARKAEEA